MAAHDTLEKWLHGLKQRRPQHVQGARLNRFVTAVRSDPTFQSILETFIQSETGTTIVTTSRLKPQLEFTFLRQAAMCGCCATLKELLDHNNVNATDDGGLTALHVAVEYGNYEDVKVLLETGAKVGTDNQGLSPLHVAALSAEPNSETAKLLIECMIQQNEESYELINAQSRQSGVGGNTALHFAAGNDEISREFIQALESVDPSVENESGETAFHVAARAENPDVIVWMLEVFTAAEKGREVADVEGETGPPLIEMCARRGNAKAVALMIKYGADIDGKVLFDLIDKSVNTPGNTQRLLDVYRTITDNCVLWSWLKAAPEERRNYPVKGTEPTAYKQLQRDIVLSLLNSRNEQGWNVVQHAIVSGAEAFLNEIINAPPKVFEITENSEEAKAGTIQHSSILYDVTNFLIPPTALCQDACRRNVTVPEDTENQETAENASGTRTSYLDLIVENGHLWESTDILQEEPFRTITEPIVRFVMVAYILIGIIQFCYMMLFSIWPADYCHLMGIFNPNVSNFGVSVDCDVSNDSRVNDDSQYYIPETTEWLIWPTALLIATLFFRHQDKSPGQVIYGLCTLRLPFAISVWMWYFTIYLDHEFYLILTSVVLLFGWLVIASCATRIIYFEKVIIIWYLLTHIILKDILSFFVVFMFILGSFSVAIHAIRESALLERPNSTFPNTMYKLFASTLTTGDFFDETLGHSPNVVSHHDFMRIMFALYLCCTAIIMLNVLISMMNNSYGMAIKTATNVRRFQMIRTGFCFIRLLAKAFRCINYFRFFRHLTSEGDKVFVRVLNKKK